MTTGSGSRVDKKRLKTARGRTVSSQRWLTRQLNDPYVAAAKAAGYRSRAAFKLEEIIQTSGLLKQVKRVVELGAAPGGWTQIVRKRAPLCKIVGIDLLPMEPIAGAEFLEMNFLDPAADAIILETLGGQPDLVLSDMAANTTGHKQTDHLRTMALVEAALEFAETHLMPGGKFVAKVLAGGADQALVARMRKAFAQVKHVKPAASRADSSEWYVVAIGFRGKVDLNL
jgi:23S rRNA (uridine2552-2'-O)-methyltransferase